MKDFWQGFLVAGAVVFAGPMLVIGVAALVDAGEADRAAERAAVPPPQPRTVACDRRSGQAEKIYFDPTITGTLPVSLGGTLTIGNTGITKATHGGNVLTGATWHVSR